MKLLKSFDKLLAAFGNIRAMERNHVDTYTEGLMSKIEGKKIAESDYGQLFISFQSLANYEFLNATILSGTNIKTFNGSCLIFDIDGKELVLLSDTQEIESDYSNISKRWLTKISFVINVDDKKMMLEKNFNKVLFKFKKKTLILNKC